MTSAVFDKAMISLMTGLVNIQANSTTTYCVLSQNTVPTKATFQTYNDVKAGGTYEIVAVDGYTAGGSGVATAIPTMSSTITALKTTGSLVFSTTGTITSYYAILQYAAASKTTTTNPLLCYLDTGVQTVTSGTLTFAWHADGIMKLTVAAAA